MHVHIIHTGVPGAVVMMTIVATILTKTRRTTDRQAVTVPREDPQNTRESMIPNLPDVAQESTIDQGHVTPESETTVAEEEEGEIEIEIETEIAQVSVEAVNTRRRTKRKKRKSDARVLLAVGPDPATKRTSP